MTGQASRTFLVNAPFAAIRWSRSWFAIVLAVGLTRKLVPMIVSITLSSGAVLVEVVKNRFDRRYAV